MDSFFLEEAEEFAEMLLLAKWKLKSHGDIIDLLIFVVFLELTVDFFSDLLLLGLEVIIQR
jgi:hypothetical protein